MVETIADFIYIGENVDLYKSKWLLFDSLFHKLFRALYFYAGYKTGHAFKQEVKVKTLVRGNKLLDIYHLLQAVAIYSQVISLYEIH